MTYCFDIDDTIFYSEYDTKTGMYEIIDANQDMIEIINTLFAEGHEIILHTGRHWNHMNITIDQLNYYNVNHHALVMGKPVADFYIDDKAITPEDFLKLYQ